MPASPLAVALDFAQILEGLGVRYLIESSVASSVHGEPRFTQDIDFVAELDENHVVPLLAALVDAYYADEQAIKEAVHERRSFNVIELQSMVKIDIFAAPRDRISETEMRRRQLIHLSETSELKAWIASAEDIVIQKLRWYRKGGGVSEVQWRDVLGVLKVRGNDLDIAYMRSSAQATGVHDLLSRAFKESALGKSGGDPPARSG